MNKEDTELEGLYLKLCEDVERMTLRIIGMAGAGRADDAGRLAASLCEHVATAKNQYKMRKESASTNRYDLGALRVDASLPSDSETGYEDRG